MTERGILFKGHLVREILAGRKTVTRRIVSPQPWERDEKGSPYSRAVWLPGQTWEFTTSRGDVCYDPQVEWRCPYGAPGDRLWVRETWQHAHPHEVGRRCPDVTDVEGCILYRADERTYSYKPTWRPSIFMPRWASRITLEVVSVRVERLQEITEEDAQAEGLPWTMNCGAKQRFKDTWDAINRKRGAWASNPWVWVIGFRRVKP